MLINQFFDTGLAHASYAVISKGEMAVIDPGRDPKPYYEFAHQREAKIVAIFETHPHADFVSAHVEMSNTCKAKIYTSKLVNAEYDHIPFDTGDEMNLGLIRFRALNTPGHSPDSISLLVIDEMDNKYAVFTGDTLFVGDVGRPDLRENVGNIKAARVDLAKSMYKSTREILMQLPEETLVYPSHGAGSLCGKNLSEERSSTIGLELQTNYALQEMSEDEFVNLILADQPFIPKYFPYAVDTNKQGADPIVFNLMMVPKLEDSAGIDSSYLIIDGRTQEKYKAGHVPGSINIPNGEKFETWLGSIVAPEEEFYLIANDETELNILIKKVAKIGYEKFIRGALLTPGYATQQSERLDLSDFNLNQNNYTVVDIRNVPEYSDLQLFDNAINIPLHELRERINEIPNDKPVVIHCAGGYRSAMGTSIVAKYRRDLTAFDLSLAVKDYYPAETH